MTAPAEDCNFLPRFSLRRRPCPPVPPLDRSRLPAARGLRHFSGLSPFRGRPFSQMRSLAGLLTRHLPSS
jgi:hypothetical protein